MSKGFISTFLFQVDMGIPNSNLTLCRCLEQMENEETSVETKDYITIALAITSFLLLVVLVMAGCYWKRKRNKDNTKTIENIEMRLQVNIYIYILKYMLFTCLFQFMCKKSLKIPKG